MGNFIDIGKDTKNVQSIGNSSTDLLLDTEIFTGSSELNDYTSVLTQVSTDQDGTLYIEFSPDGTNWDTSLNFNYKVGQINPPKWIVKLNRYCRIRFENNSGSNQTYLRLYTYYSYNAGVLVSPINSTLSETFDASVVRPTDYFSEVAMGKRQGRTTWNKFGYNPDVDTANEEIIASWGGFFDPTTDIITTAQTLDISYNSSTDGVGNSGAISLFFTYIDENFESQTAVHVLGSSGSDTTSFTCLGINRCVVLSSGSSGYNENDITGVATTDGSTQFEIPAENSVTQQAIFHTQINHNFLANWIFMNVLKLSGGSSPRVRVYGYSYSRVTGTRYQIFRHDQDTAIENTIELTPLQPFVVGGREVLYFTMETNSNNTEVDLRFSGIEERIN